MPNVCERLRIRWPENAASCGAPGRAAASDHRPCKIRRPLPQSHVKDQVKSGMAPFSFCLCRFVKHVGVWQLNYNRWRPILHPFLCNRSICIVLLHTQRHRSYRFFLTKGPLCGYNIFRHAGVVQRLVHQPSKLRTRVRLPSPAPNPHRRSIQFCWMLFFVK